jgi:hypothetical protein
MYVFRIHIRPSGGAADMPTTFNYCLKNGILGSVGEQTQIKIQRTGMNISMKHPRYMTTYKFANTLTNGLVKVIWFGLVMRLVNITLHE